MSNSIIAENRRARFVYQFSEFFEAGVVLTGSEIKAVRAKRVDLSAAYSRIIGSEALLINMNLSDGKTPDPTRTRKLLLHAREIGRLTGMLEQKGLTLVPLKLYFKRGRAKLELGVGKGRKTHDKRELIKKRDEQREQLRGMRVK